MERRRAPDQPNPGDLAVEAAAALRALTAVDPEPLLLGVYPSFTTNPYQSLLYQRARDHGIAPIRLARAWQLGELAGLARAGLPVALHLHWLGPIVRDAGSAREAARALDDFVARLDEHRAAGGRLVWTVHNVLSHETRWEAEEARLSRAVAERCDVVHVMSARTPEAVEAHYALPRDRLLVVPHMSYAGAYEDHVSRLDARHELGLLPDDLVYLALGYIRPYKGLDVLLEAWQALPPGRRRLVVAGDPADDPSVAAFLEKAAVDPTVVLDARPIPPDEIQVFLRAADIAVLPYRNSLNSGALLLALTFGLPAIVPAGTALADLVQPGFGRAYDPDSPSDLRDVLAAAGDLAGPRASAAAEAAAEEVSPPKVSDAFASGLRAMLFGVSEPA